MKSRIAVFGILATILVVVAVYTLPALFSTRVAANDSNDFVVSHTIPRTPIIDELMAQATEFVVAQHKQTGGTHYSYTEYVAAYMRAIDNTRAVGAEGAFYFEGSRLTMIRLTANGDEVTVSERILLDSPYGFIRDPDVSADGRYVLFSWKQDAYDDFSLYEMDLASGSIRQLTFGAGVADIEGRYLPDGNIVFHSTRGILTVPCWHTPVSNLFIMGPNGEDIRRVGFDQVQTTSPAVLSDGRVIYTRWDYNDRNQQWSRGIFSMNHDGTHQIELFGNNLDFPTSLIHTREVPGHSDRFISIASGHHTLQAGKLVWVDLGVGRNNPDAVQYVIHGRGNSPERNHRVDHFGQSGPMYKFPYSFSSTGLLVASAQGGWADGGYRGRARTVFNIYVVDTETGELTMLVRGTPDLPASQIVPVRTRTLAERASSVNTGMATGVFYIADIYMGDSMVGVQRGDAHYLRVIELVYRPFAIGATIARGGSLGGFSDPFTPIATGRGSWDVKNVLGIVDIHEDGSVLFRVPANTPIYFQVLNARGEVIQTMRSWTTLMPNEFLSCISCHSDKSQTPPASAGFTQAMAHGVQELRLDRWQVGEYWDNFDPYITRRERGFSFLQEIQPILDASCIACHSNTWEAVRWTNADGLQGSEFDGRTNIMIDRRSQWSYTTTQPGTSWNTHGYNDASWGTDFAPFGSNEIIPFTANTVWTGDNIWMRYNFIATMAQIEVMELYLEITNLGPTRVYINGQEVYATTDYNVQYERVRFTQEMRDALVLGHNNTIAVVSQRAESSHVDIALIAELVGSGDAESIELLPVQAHDWRFMIEPFSGSRPADGWHLPGFDDSSWSIGRARFGSYGPGMHTHWAGNDMNIWIRRTIYISQEDYDTIIEGQMPMVLSIWYDECPVIYINGQEMITFSGYITSYIDVPLPHRYFADFFQPGINTIAISALNTVGGAHIDIGLTAVAGASPMDILPRQSEGWSYFVRHENQDGPPQDWAQPGFDASAWTVGRAAFGSSGSGINTKWTGSNMRIWLRRDFEISQADFNYIAENMRLYLVIWYNEDPVVYINGRPVIGRTGYRNAYQYIPLPALFLQEYFVPGTNTIAVRAWNHGGGSAIDVGIYARPRSHIPISFQDFDVFGYRQFRNWPLSYLVLTGTIAEGQNVVGRPFNTFTHYLSSMSPSALIPPNTFGSGQSFITRVIRNEVPGHPQLNLTDAEISAFNTWIDMVVPAFGAYDEENSRWGMQEHRIAQESVNMREFHNLLDDWANMSRAGLFANSSEIEISYTRTNATTYTQSGAGYTVLNLPHRLAPGDEITVTLPEGERYFMFGLSSRFGVALMYAPDGVFTYTIPNLANATFPRTMLPDDVVAFTANDIIAGVVPDRLMGERRNLARNQFALASDSPSGITGAYPHVTASPTRAGVNFAARNAIDGFTVNSAAATTSYPMQSWEPLANTEPYLTVHFGRDVVIDGVGVTVRGNFSNDFSEWAGRDHFFTHATLEFSDGSSQIVSLRRTRAPQRIDINPVTTSWVRLVLAPAYRPQESLGGIIQFETFGTIRTAGPASVAAVDVSSPVLADGAITGVSPAMEFRPVTSRFAYSEITGNEIAGLRPGTYYVRYIDGGNGQPSQDVRVVVRVQQ